MQLVDQLLSFHSNWFNHLIWMYLNQNIFHRSYPLSTVYPTIRPPQKYNPTTTPETRPPQKYNHTTTPEIQPYNHPRNATNQPTILQPVFLGANCYSTVHVFLIQVCILAVCIWQWTMPSYFESWSWRYVNMFYPQEIDQME